MVPAYTLLKIKLSISRTILKLLHELFCEIDIFFRQKLPETSTVYHQLYKELYTLHCPSQKPDILSHGQQNIFAICYAEKNIFKSKSCLEACTLHTLHNRSKSISSLCLNSYVCWLYFLPVSWAAGWRVLRLLWVMTVTRLSFLQRKWKYLQTEETRRSIHRNQ